MWLAFSLVRHFARSANGIVNGPELICAAQILYNNVKSPFKLPAGDVVKAKTCQDVGFRALNPSGLSCPIANAAHGTQAMRSFVEQK